MSSSAEKEILQLLHRQQQAWNTADAIAYAQDCDEHLSFTNIVGQVLFGHKAFEERHIQIFSSIFRGSALEMHLRRLHFPLPDVAVVDLDVSLENYVSLPPGVTPQPDGTLRTSLLQVFAFTPSGWKVIAYHNVDAKI